MTDSRQALYPEVQVGGYSRADTTVDFYTRVNALLDPKMIVVDFGAGRGQFMDADPWFRQDLQLLKGKAAQVIGLDVDPAVTSNPSLDAAHILAADGSWPIEDNSVDLVVSDWTLEHVTNPGTVGSEAARTIKSGGWFCARTPNKHGYIAVGARMVPNRLHVAALGRLQPLRQARDVFPTRYLLNTPKDVKIAFPDFEVFHYTMNGEPAYFGRSRAAWRAAQTMHRLIPSALGGISLYFLRRRPRVVSTA